MKKIYLLFAAAVMLTACGDDAASSAPENVNGSSTTELSSATDLEKSSDSKINSNISSSSTYKEPEDSDHFVDARDGRKYKIAHLFSQSWMAENLKYEDGESTCIYWNPENCEEYGRFYTWEGATKACPEGWRMPTQKDWNLISKETWRAGYYEYTGFLTATSGVDSMGTYGFGARFTGIDTVGTDSLGKDGWVGLNYSVDYWVAGEFNDEYGFGVEMNMTNGSPSFLFNDRHALPNKKYRLPVRCIKETEGSMTDSRDGQTYRTIAIGNQVWIGENLNYKTDSSRTRTGEENNPHKYGQLYSYNDAEKVCPSGWHLPTVEEWQPLINLVDDNAASARLTLKSSEGWSNEYIREDDYGFTAYPSGYINDFGGLEINGKTFLEYDDNALMWAKTPEQNKNKSAIMISDNFFDAEAIENEPTYNFYSVRCIRD